MTIDLTKISKYGSLLTQSSDLPFPPHLLSPFPYPFSPRVLLPPALRTPIPHVQSSLLCSSRPYSSFEFRTWDPEGVLFYGDTNTEDDWFMLGLRDGQLEIQLHNLWARLTVGFGPRLNDGRWHPVRELCLCGEGSP